MANHGPSLPVEDGSPKPQSHIQNQPIFNLPYEVLYQIFSLAVPVADESDIFLRNGPLNNYGTLANAKISTPWAICLVCKHFNHFATPLLYHTLSISSHPASVNYSSEILLHKTLRQKSTLRNLCQKLYIEFSDAVCVANPVERLIGEAIPLLNNAKYLHISGGITASVQTYGVVKLAVQSMKQIQELHLKNGSVGLLLAPIFTAMDFPLLKKLTLTGIMTQPRDPSIWPAENSEGAAGFTSLNLHDFGEGPDGLSNLIKWTSRIEDFVFLGYLAEQTQSDWTLYNILSYLTPHHSVLKTLEIGMLPGDASLQNADFSLFKSLESIKLISWSIDSTPDKAASIFLTAPKLLNITWHFATSGAWPAEWGEAPIIHFENVPENGIWKRGRPHFSWRADFSPREGQWLRLFAEHMIAGKSSVRKIHIQFSPLKSFRKYSHPLKSMMTKEYKSCAVDEVREIVGPRSLEIVYRRPELHLPDRWVYDGIVLPTHPL